MSTAQPIERRPWEEDGRIVPSGPARDAEDLPREMTAGDVYWTADEDPVEHEGRYVVVVAARGPDPGDEPHYYALTLPSEYEAGKALGRIVGGPMQALEKVLGPLGRRVRSTLKETAERFVGLSALAEELGLDADTISQWRTNCPDFPPAVFERGGDPLFVREEVDEWLRRHERPPRDHEGQR